MDGVRLVEHAVIGTDFRHVITTWVSVPPEVAFDYVSDFGRHPEWATVPLVVEPRDDGPTRVGSRFHAVGTQGGKQWPSDLVVTRFDRPGAFGFSATGGPIGTTSGHLHEHEFELTPERGGTRLLVRRTDPIPNRFVRLILPLVTRFALRVRMQTIENLRRRLEELQAAP